jgi:hypothetical protein
VTIFCRKTITGSANTGTRFVEERVTKYPRNDMNAKRTGLSFL